MSTQSDFTDAEWTLLRTAPTLAGLRVAVADHGGGFQEVAAIAEAYGDAHERWWTHPERGGLIDEITDAGPVYDRGRFGTSPDELRPEQVIEAGTVCLRDAIALLERTAQAAELDDYRDFVLRLARGVAEAHREAGIFESGRSRVSDRERAVLDDLARSFPSSASQEGATRS